MPKRLHRCVAFAVNGSVTVRHAKGDRQASLPARSEANESQQSARSLFNEQKRIESQMDRMKEEVSSSNKAVDKMRDKTIRLRSKVN